MYTVLTTFIRIKLAHKSLGNKTIICDDNII